MAGHVGLSEEEEEKKKGRWGINTNLKVCLTVALDPM